MATSQRMSVPVGNTGLLKFSQTEEAAQKTSELLQKDLEDYHVYFNKSGFHNHIPHHLLALYGTGSPTPYIERAFVIHKEYQLPARPIHQDAANDIPTSWDSYLGNEDNYSTLLAFFQREIDTKGWKAVMTEYLFDGSPRAEDMLQRMFAGFLHPLIQLMYGLEWEQPAIIAQALAEAAIHNNMLGEVLVEGEQRARERGSAEKKWSIRELFDLARSNDALRGSIRSEDANKVTDGVLTRAKEEMLGVIEHVGIPADQSVVDERTAEMFEACVVMTVSQAVVESKKRGKEERCDFFLMHHVNASPILVSINRQDWIPVDVKARILEWKIRMDLVQYVARGSSPVDVDAMLQYTPADTSLTARPEDILPKIHNIEQDSHPIKMARALLVCRDLVSKYADRPWALVKGDEAWAKIMALLYESTYKNQHMWTRSGGLDDAWKEVPDKN